MISRKDAKKIQNQIAELLFDDWDPVGVNDMAPNDEYDSYVGGIYRLLVSGADERQLAAHLQQVEVEQMGIVTNPDHRTLVSRKLLDLGVNTGGK
jgi:hypothetical protein